MHVTACEFKAGTLTMKTTSPDALKFAITFKEGDYTLEKERKLRSLDANAYAWVLIGLIAEKVPTSKDIVYISAIHEVGSFAANAFYGEDAYNEFCRVWETRGTGWFVEKTDENNGWIYCNAYYGSSVYDARQMSRLIDYLIQDCEVMGIDYDNGRIASLLEEWEKKHG